MKDLRQAHVQQFYRPLSISFVAIVVLVILGAVYVGWSSTTITVTPQLTPISTQLNVTVGGVANAGDTYHLNGTIEIQDTSATVTVTPKGDGDLVPAHASGTMTIKNTSTNNQPLAAGTRLRSSSDVIVRTDVRVDVPAGGSVEVTVIADPLGAEGNLPVGRFIIVALWPGLQDKIFGELTEPMSGGLTRGQGSLALSDLTAASTEAENQLRTTAGSTKPGTFIIVTPSAVVSTPKPEIPSATYQVTVKAKVLTITYDNDQLTRLAQAELKKSIHDGQMVATTAPFEISLTSQPSTDQVVFLITINGQQRIDDGHDLLTPTTYAGLTRQAASDKLRDSKLFKSYIIRLSPSWHTTIPDQPERITVRRQTPQS